MCRAQSGLRMSRRLVSLLVGWRAKLCGSESELSLPYRSTKASLDNDRYSVSSIEESGGSKMDVRWIFEV
jgi:hypothetical protein